MYHRLKNMNRKKRLKIGGICLLFLLITSYFYFNQNNTNKVKLAKGNPLVSIYTVNRGNLMRHISLSGQTVANATVDLAPKYTGKISSINVELGDVVKAGDILIMQDTSDLDISIKESEAATNAASTDAITEEASYNANYLKAKETYMVEQQKYDRNQYLYSIGAISKDTLDSIYEAYMASKANFEALANQSNGSLPASVQSKQFAAQKSAYATDALIKQRNDMILTAPRDGIIAYRNAEVGEIASAGTKLLSIVDNNHIYIDCSISENDAALLTTGTQVDITIDSMGNTYKGELIYVSPAIDDTNKSYTVRIALNESPDVIKAGLFAHGQIDILQKSDTLFVPKEAVINQNGKMIVFVVKSDNTVEQREVKIGLLNDEFEEIISGINDGETVALSNQDRLKDGIKVDTTTEASS